MRTRFIPFLAAPVVAAMLCALLYMGCTASRTIEAKRFEPLTENLADHAVERRRVKGSSGRRLFVAHDGVTLSVHADLMYHPEIGTSLVTYTIQVENESSESVLFDPEDVAAYAYPEGGSAPSLKLEHRFWESDIVSAVPGGSARMRGGFRPPEHNTRLGHLEFSLSQQANGEIYGYRFHF